MDQSVREILSQIPADQTITIDLPKQEVRTAESYYVFVDQIDPTEEKLVNISLMILALPCSMKMKSLHTKKNTYLPSLEKAYQTFIYKVLMRPLLSPLVHHILRIKRMTGD